MAEYRVEVHGGAVINEGKAYWPDHLRVEIGRSFAWALVREVLAQLQDGQSTVIWTTVGSVTPTPDDEEPMA